MIGSLGRIETKAILPVDDMDTAVEFYRRIGFDVTSYDDGYAWVRHRGEEVLHLRLALRLVAATNETSVYLHVGSADDWHAAIGAAGVDVGDVTDTPWEMREFAFTDPSGNHVRVGHNLL